MRDCVEITKVNNTEKQGLLKSLIIDALIFHDGKAYGYQEYLFNLLDYFAEHRNSFDYERIVLVCPKSQVKSFEKYNSAFEIIGFNAENKKNHLLVQNRMEKLLKLRKNDVVLFTYNYSSLFKHCKHVLVVHDLLYLRKNYLPKRLMRLQRMLFVPISLKKADKIIAISDFTKRDIINNYRVDFSKINTIYNYFNFNKYRPVENYFKCERPYFVSICSTAYHKNTVSVLKAFKIFCEQDNEHDIVFIGALSDKTSDAFIEYDSLPNDIKKRIHILSHISNEELGMIYRNAECFISLTLFEGLGMPIVEAMYFNLPLILSDLEVCREVVGNEKANFVNPFDIETIKEIMLEITGETKNIKSQALIQERFSQENTSGKYIEILNLI